jgi:phosphonate degradation associated HDIG domain protein
MMNLIERIEAIFERHGRKLYDGERAEPVAALAHALQCAQLAEWAQADPPLVAAALLHDIGHFIDAPPDADGEDDAHELRAIPFLAAGFGADVLEPVRLHVQAKRYLVATDVRYGATLTPASLHSLALQGGPMDADERRWFEELPFAQQALQLRRWDDAAKVPGQRVPPLGYYLALLEEVAESQGRSAATKCRSA